MNFIISLQLFSVSILSAALFPAFVSAAIHYVSPTGLASWAQSSSINSPCSTAIAFANAVAGDTVYFRGGVYHTPKRNFGDSYSGYYNPANSGMPSNYIVFMAYPSEVPLFSGLAGGLGDQTSASSNIYATIFGTKNNSYLVFDGFIFLSDTGKKMARMMIGIDHTDETTPRGHCIIKNCVFHGGSSSNNSVDNNEGLRIEGNNFITVSNCRFIHYNNAGNNHNTSAIKTYWDTSIVINNCEFDSSTVGVYLKEANPNATVYNCYFIGNYEGFLISSEIMIRSESDNLKFHDNIIINSSYVGFNWEGAGSDSGTHGDDYLIYNNTFFGNVQNVLFGFTSSGHGASFYNNISAGAAGTNNLVTDDYNTAWQNRVKQADHNEWGAPFKIIRIGDNGRNINYSSLTSWQASGQLENPFDAGCGSSSNPGCGDLASNPQFSNGSGAFSQPSDFTLASNSPCKHAGRNGVNDIGANADSVGLQNGLTVAIHRSVKSIRQALSASGALPSRSIMLANGQTALISGKQVFDICGKLLRSDRARSDGIYILVKP
jgi:Right handed beta helix region